MWKKALLILLLLMLSIGCVYASTVKVKLPYKVKLVETQTKDNHIIKSKLIYPIPPKDVKGIKYPTVILLHSLGYSSSNWGTLPELLVKQGYAVLMIDLRGHGLSNKDVRFNVSSWTYYSTKKFAYYPDDIITVINNVKQTVKKASFDNYSIVGGDIGANTGVLVAQKMPQKPKSLVLLTPAVAYKGLTIATLSNSAPISHVGSGQILVMCSQYDKTAVEQEMLLKKFTKPGQYIINNVPIHKNGMLILRNNDENIKVVIDFLNKNMKPQPKDSIKSIVQPTK